MSFTFEWDEEKAAENLIKHRVSFSEASTVFGDPLSRTVPDPRPAAGTPRFYVRDPGGNLLEITQASA
jgi:uncharacterized DUF497 family protein